MKYFPFIRLMVGISLFFTGGFQVLSGQDTTLQMIIKNQSQETKNWCWAASMKMIMDFHDPSSSALVSQCALVKQLFKHETPGINLSTINCCTDCHKDEECNPFGTQCSNSGPQYQLANKTIPFTDEFVQLGAEPDYFDLIFTKNGYSSMQEVNQIGNPFKWEHIKDQIKQCRPFIINVQDVPGVQALGNHALVVKGYEELLSTENQYIITNDPWRPCCTNEDDETLLPYDIFTTLTGAAAGGSFVSGVLSTVHSIETGTIFKNEGKECRSCDLLETTYSNQGTPFREKRVNGAVQTANWYSPDFESIAPPAKLVAYPFQTPPQGDPKGSPSRLLNLLRKNSTRVAGYRQNALKPSAMEAFYEAGEYYHAPVQYITSSLVNRRYFLACLFPPRKLEKVIISNAEVVDIVSGDVDKNLVSTLQKRNDGNWVLRKISTYTHIEKDIGIDMANAQGDTLFLKNNGELEEDPGRVEYKLVKYRPFQYEFFSFTQNGKKYMAPAATYKDLGLEAKKAYPEGKVVRSLRKETINYEKFIKNLFGKLSDYKIYTGEQKALNNTYGTTK